jgi:hypothetical protein
MEQELTFFDRLSIANCAKQRAEQNCCDSRRFSDEFFTARMWARYRCYITREIQFVEPD